MLVDIIPSYGEEISIEDLTPDEFLLVAIDASRQLGWKVGQVSSKGFLAYRKQSTGSTNEELMVAVLFKIALIRSRYRGVSLVPVSRTKDNVEEFLAKARELKPGFNPESNLERLQNLKENYVPVEHSFMNQPPSTYKEDLSGFMGLFIPRSGYFVAPIIIWLNLLVFLLMTISRVHPLVPDAVSLVKWGANVTGLTSNGQWWRLLTSCFVHGGFVHLAANMIAFTYIALLLEPRMGSIKFLIAYIFTGVVASTVSLWWHVEVISVGASGAIFGMYGVCIAMLATNLLAKEVRDNLLPSVVLFVVYNLLGGMGPGIDNSAHMGGLIAGLVIGFALYPSLKKSILPL